ncbi:hypothetical protein JZ751_012911 [Albula glossodonta]|uniref:Secreted protein n=1 Tax=Albula glossodonta TaxID=121402 RepID=A0A8T2N9S9_9TELE|nr:hypothetical protein JZ751_012911 [Albula glossodonta]
MMCKSICTVSYYSTLLLLTHLYCVLLQHTAAAHPSVLYPPDEITYADINHRARRTQGEVGAAELNSTFQTGSIIMFQKESASDDTVYSNVNHKRPKKQEATAPRATQEESICVYAEVRRKQ